MSRKRSQSRHAATTRRGLAIALAAAIAPGALPAVAQQQPQQQQPQWQQPRDPLRGSITDTPLDRQSLINPDEPRDPLEPRRPRGPYEPVSRGALPDEEQLDGLVEVETDPSAARRASPASAAAMARRGIATGSAGEEEEAASPRPGQSASRPATDPLSTGTARTGTIDSDDELRNVAVSATAERAAAVGIDDREIYDNPFEPVGIRAGTFVLRPSLEQGIEWNSNAAGAAGGGSDFLSESTLRLNAESDWSRHAATLDLFGTYRRSITGTGFSEFRGGADAALRLDLADRTTVDAALGYNRGPEDASSPVDIPNLDGRPTRQTLSGSVGLDHGIGRIRLGATGSVERNIYGDAPLQGGGSLSQADRDQTLYTMALRGGYEISPAITPFVEAEIGRRIYDQAADSAGYRRSAMRFGARAGVELALGEKLNGEVAAGWVTERPDDTRLAPVSGVSIDAALAWSPIRGTTVDLTGSTEIEGTTTPGASGSVLYASTLGVTRELRSNLSATATFGASLRDYALTTDSDLTLSGELALTWWLNRYAGIRGRARQEWLRSTLPGRDYQSTSVYLGLTLQR